MKIIEGQFAGKHVTYRPRPEQRVTSEKVRKAAFDILKQYIDLDGAAVLDLFAGSGLYGFEAVSRGAARAAFVESSRDGAKALKDTSEYFGLKQRVTILCQKVERFLSENHLQYDIVFVDPPYFDFQYEILKNLAGHVADQGIVVLEASKKVAIPDLKGMSLIEDRLYGDTILRLYRKD